MKNYILIFHIRWPHKQISLIFIILSLVACTKPAEEIKLKSESIQKELAIETFSIGFQQISARYIKKISVEELALNGLKGLSNIDPSIQIRKVDNTVTIKSNIIKKRLYKAPTTHDARGWAQLTVAAIDHIKSGSITFRQTKMIRFYEVIFDGSLSLLDVFSRYRNKKEAKKNQEKRSGFGGIGIQFKNTKNGIVVTQVYTESPAFIAGIKVKDVITHIGKSKLKGLTSSQTSNLLRGKIGSIVDVRILPLNDNTLNTNNSSSLNLSLKRDRVFAPTISYALQNGVLHIQLSSFNGRTARDLTFNLTHALKKVSGVSGKKTKGIIIDLRDNPGGVLKQAVKVTNLFLSNGKITSTQGRHPSSNHNYNAYGKDITNGLPVVILINGRSASAAEILAAAMQDHARGIVIGSTSHGKGTIQTVIKLPNEGEIAITWSRFKTPSGYFPHELGIPPSICVTGLKQSLVSQHIQNTLKQKEQFLKMRLAWHGVTINQKRERKRLKAICPTNHKKGTIGIEIAEKLILNPTLYQKVGALGPPNLAIKN